MKIRETKNGIWDEQMHRQKLSKGKGITEGSILLGLEV
jgi:hypothetical protein